MADSPRALKLLLSLVAAAVVVGLVLVYLPRERAPEPVPGGCGEYFVRRIIDGDTVVVDGPGKVRLLGIDTPERGEDGYAAARDRLSELIGGRWVTLHFDTELYDRYDRLLGYPVLERGGEEIAVCPVLVAEGLAEPLFYDPNHRFRDEITAALEGRGAEAGKEAHER
jgi:endonuclease YncB( thermonuclease family)